MNFLITLPQTPWLSTKAVAVFLPRLQNAASEKKPDCFNEMEGYTMTEAQKNEAVKMFQAGRSYKEIGEQIGTTPGSVKQFFYRRRKQPVAYICEQCHQPIKLFRNKPHRFCSYACRMKWWLHHPEAYSNREQHCFRCKICGKSFYSRRNIASFCSRACYYESRRKG